MYKPADSIESLVPNEGVVGEPSDHRINILFPKSDTMLEPVRRYQTITIRPISNSDKAAMGQVIASQDWHELLINDSVDKKLEIFSETIDIILDVVAPKKTVKIACDDPPWMTAAIKNLMRKRNREYDKKKKSEKWRILNKEVKVLCKKAKEKLAAGFIENLKDTDPKGWMSKMKK